MESVEWMNVAFAELEMSPHEILGSDNNSRIVEYLASVTGEALPDEVAWCAAFISFCLEQSGITPTKSLRARSYLHWGRKIEKPVFGCVTVLKRGKLEWQGHVGFYIGQTEDSVWLLGGNQKNKVSILGFCPDDVLGYVLPNINH